MACLWVVDRGNSLQIWGIAMNILNQQLQTVDKRWFFSLRVRPGCPYHKNQHVMKMLHRALD
jgi:hypothetical protein